MLADPVNEWLWDMRVSFSGSVCRVCCANHWKTTHSAGVENIKGKRSLELKAMQMLAGRGTGVRGR